MNSVAEPVGTLAVALQHAARLLNSDPAAAAEQAAEILKVAPQHPTATLVLGVAQRRTGNLANALDTLSSVVSRHTEWAPAHLEFALATGEAGNGEAAIASLRRAIELQRDLPAAWIALGDHLSAVGDAVGADAAYAEYLKYSTRDPRLLKAAAALVDNDIPQAEALLREHLRQAPTDVAAIRMLAEVAARIGRYEDAEKLLARCLELAPSFTAARQNYAMILHRQYKSEEALREANQLLEIDARNPGFRNLKAAILGRLGNYDESIALYAGVLADYPNHAKVWMSYGHALKTAGREADCIDAYRKSIALAPGLGEAWWSLANLKTSRFSALDVDTMRRQLQRAELSEEDRFHFHFTLGKALEDTADYADSFKHYALGNRLRRQSVDYDAADTTRKMRRFKQFFTPELFAERRNSGCQAADPIFIVGLPRAGSTLLEQILSSHPLVEGTMELPDIATLVRDLALGKVAPTTDSPLRYLDVLAALDANQLSELGTRYLQSTSIQRKTAAPFFIDKMPNNFLHVGFIQLILPNAKIIDARRHPLGCCFSGFKQHFARGQHFTYDLTDIGHYYRDYVELMAHFDAVLPGRVHRVIYETLIDDFELEVRRLLDYCGLSFDERCLRFFENDRAVRTASSQQVRQPIYREGVEQWKHFEPWLGPLKTALHPVLERYPAAPAF
jgi:tetratricopeptide (TPR) repeat protein